MTEHHRIALVTGLEMAKPDPESHLLVDALAAIGISADVLAWQTACDWSAYSLVLVRTPWDYFRHREAFLNWAENVNRVARLVNPSQVLRWNSHKGYLRELSEAGVPVVPTLWLGHGTSDLASLHTCEWGEVVVKPAVSIGAIGARRGHLSDTGMLEHVQTLLVDGDVMVQPYIAEVADAGELSLIYFGGEFSHAVRKLPKPGDFRVQDMYGGTKELVAPAQAARDLAGMVLRCIPDDTAYARIDLVSHSDRWFLMELELIEPELFLPLSPGSAERFAAAISRYLSR